MFIWMCGDRSRFKDILQCCSLSECVSGPTHIQGHTLDILISPCDTDFVRNAHLGDFISDHAAMRCKLDFSHPTTCIEKMVSYHRYHRNNIDQFRNNLSNITLEELWQNCIISIWLMLPRYLTSMLLSSHA